MASSEEPAVATVPSHYKGLRPDFLAREEVLARSVVAPWTTIVNGAHCRVWMGGISGYGYGITQIHGGRRVRPHAIVLACSQGQDGIEPGKHTRHLCLETGLCVEERHLAAGSSGENQLDSYAAGRAPTCSHAMRGWVERRRLGVFVCGCKIEPENTLINHGSPACRRHSNARLKEMISKAVREAVAYQNMTAALTGTFDLLPKRRREEARALARYTEGVDCPL